MAEPVASADFVAAMGLHVSSVCVITTLHDGLRHGLTATAVSSLTAEPPRLLVCINKSGTTHEKVLAAGHFCVNVLEEHQDRVAKAFSGMLGRDFDRFSAGDWSVLSTGSPVLAGAAAVFDCRIAATLDQSTHTVFIGEAVAVAARPGHDTLLYGARRFRTLRKLVSSPAPDDMDTLSF